MPQGGYVLLIASDSDRQSPNASAARAWIEAGAVYVCAWGPNARETEEAFDYATFLPELGEPLPFTLMTTSHGNEPLEDALWFAFYNGKPDGEDGSCPVLVVVDSTSLENQATAWIRGNFE